MKQWHRVLFVSLLLLGAFPLHPSKSEADHDPLLIIASHSAPVSSITLLEVKQMFLKQRTSWPGGGKIVVLNARSGSEERKTFQAKVLDMDDGKETAYWQEQKIKKGITPPPEIGNTQKGVFSLKKSVSYCLQSQYKTGTSKILLTL